MKTIKIVCHSSDGRWLSLYVEHACSKTIVKEWRKEISDKGDIAFLNKYEDGSYSFGIIQGDYKSNGHSKGYIWSSRASVMNQLFGTHITETAVRLPGEECYFHRAFDVEALENILPKDYKFVESPYDDGEISINLVYSSSIPIEYKCGKILYSVEETESPNIVMNLGVMLQDQKV